MALRPIGTVTLPHHAALGGFDHACVCRDADHLFNSRRGHLYVAIGDPGVVQVIDPANAVVMETVATEKGAHTIGFDPEREHVYAFVPGTHSALVFAET